MKSTLTSLIVVCDKWIQTHWPCSLTTTLTLSQILVAWLLFEATSGWVLLFMSLFWVFETWSTGHLEHIETACSHLFVVLETQVLEILIPQPAVAFAMALLIKYVLTSRFELQWYLHMAALYLKSPIIWKERREQQRQHIVQPVTISRKRVRNSDDDTDEETDEEELSMELKKMTCPAVVTQAEKKD